MDGIDLTLATGLLAVLALNLLTYAAFASDKRRAVAGEWRVAESTLLTLAALGGWPAAKLAQHRLRHKTRKQPFRTRLNLSVLPMTAVLAFLASNPAAVADVVGRVTAGMATLSRASEVALPRRFGPGSDAVPEGGSRFSGAWVSK